MKHILWNLISKHEALHMKLNQYIFENKLSKILIYFLITFLINNLGLWNFNPN